MAQSQKYVSESVTRGLHGSDYHLPASVQDHLKQFMATRRKKSSIFPSQRIYLLKSGGFHMLSRKIRPLFPWHTFATDPFSSHTNEKRKPYSFLFCGEWGIRTPGPVKINGFQDRRIRPLCQLSNRFLKWDLLPLVAYPFQKGLQRYK